MSTGRRNTTNKDYRALAGMSLREKNHRSGGGSKKSGASNKLKKSGKDDHRTVEMRRLDDELDELQDKLDNNPAVQAEAYEKYVREYGTVFVT